jgi:hypothetical protein
LLRRLATQPRDSQAVQGVGVAGGASKAGAVPPD